MMPKTLSDLTDEELSKTAKYIQPTKIYDAVIFGFLVGVAIYSAVVNGVGLFTFLPLIYIPVAKRNKTKRKELEKLLKEKKFEILIPFQWMVGLEYDKEHK